LDLTSELFLDGQVTMRVRISFVCLELFAWS